MSATLTKPMTADELLAMPDDGNRYELVKGELIRMAPTGDEHGRVGMNLAGPLQQYAKQHNLGVVYLAETGFKIHANPDTVLAPDIAFVSRQRFDQEGAVKAFRSGAPDLLVEVISPGDTVLEVENKVAEWLGAGASIVWVVSPKLHTVTIYRSLINIVTLTEKDTLDGADVVPGFQIRVTEIFAS